jgi:hypothetical protein
MTDIAYAFNHQLLYDRIMDTANCESVVISLCNLTIPTNGKTCMHMIAEFCDANGNPIQNSDKQIGCPYPPGWQNGRYNLTGLDLRSCPRFIVPKADILASLAQNEFQMGTDKELCAHVAAATDNISGVYTLIGHIKILSQTRNGSAVVRIQKAIAFEP